MTYTPTLTLIPIPALLFAAATPECSPKTADVNLLIIVALILIAAFMIYIFINKKNKY